MNRIAFAVVTGTVLSLAAQADTVTFPDGSTMDGIVREINDNCVELEADGVTFLLQRTEIASFEKNDKRAVPGKTQLPMVEQAENEINERTGLNAEQREAALALIDGLMTLDDPEARKQMEGRLRELANSIDIVHFIEATFEEMQPRQRMAYLNAMFVLRPAAAIPYLRDAVLVPNARYRAFALRLLAKAALAAGKVDGDTVALIARGLADIDPDVQIAAAYALVDCNQKQPTPVLIAMLAAQEPRVHNAADQSLARIWEIDPAELPADRTAYWNSVWTSHAAEVASPIDPEKLVPLVDKDAAPIDTHH